MKRNDVEFAQAVLALEAVGGPAWETFLKHVRQYREQCAKDLIASSPDTILVAQGRAKGAEEMLSAITSARDVAGRR